VLPHLKSGALQAVLADIQPDDEPVWAVYPQQHHLLPKIAQAVEWLQRNLGSAF
jgi:DNA-binding transcriptional LysR family regulator